jgi:hypothetical protein
LESEDGGKKCLVVKPAQRFREAAEHQLAHCEVDKRARQGDHTAKDGEGDR